MSSDDLCSEDRFGLGSGLTSHGRCGWQAVADDRSASGPPRRGAPVPRRCSAWSPYGPGPQAIAITAATATSPSPRAPHGAFSGAFPWTIKAHCSCSSTKASRRWCWQDTPESCLNKESFHLLVYYWASPAFKQRLQFTRSVSRFSRPGSGLFT